MSPYIICTEEVKVPVQPLGEVWEHSAEQTIYNELLASCWPWCCISGILALERLMHEFKANLGDTVRHYENKRQRRKASKQTKIPKQTITKASTLNIFNRRDLR